MTLTMCARGNGLPPNTCGQLALVATVCVHNPLLVIAFAILVDAKIAENKAKLNRLLDLYLDKGIDKETLLEHETRPTWMQNTLI